MLQVLRVLGVCLARPVHALDRPEEGLVRLLHVVEYLGTLRDVRPQRVLDAPRGRLAVAAPDGDYVLVGVDRDGDAYLVPAEAAPRPPSGLALEVGVGHVHLVDPDLVPQHDPVLAAVDGGHDPVPPLPGGPVRYAAELGAGVELRVEAHEAYEEHPPPERLLGVLEDGPGERAEPEAAAAALPARVAGGRPPVRGAVARLASRAARARPPPLGRLVVVADADQLAAPPGLDGFLEHAEAVPREGIDLRREGVRPHGHGGIPIRPCTHPTGIVAKQSAGWAHGQIFVWHAYCIVVMPTQPRPI